MARSGSFEEFYTGTVGRLLGQLFLVTGDLHEAEEIVQEAYTRAAARWSVLRDYDVPEAWVRRVAMNLAADRARTLRRQTKAVLKLRPPPEVLPASVEALALAEALRTPTDPAAAGAGPALSGRPAGRAGRSHPKDARGHGQEPPVPRPPDAGGQARRGRGGAVSPMSDLRERLQELADVAARQGRTPGPEAALRRARRRRLRLAGGTAVLLAIVLLAVMIGADRLTGPAPLAPSATTRPSATTTASTRPP
jgi:Sigma-70 region 2